jgi:hypothetical protein
VAIIKGRHFDPPVDRSYAEMAVHYDMAALPTRPRKPKQGRGSDRQANGFGAPRHIRNRFPKSSDWRQQIATFDEDFTREPSRSWAAVKALASAAKRFADCALRG